MTSQWPAWGRQPVDFFVVCGFLFTRRLTHLPLVQHICVSQSGQHCFRLWLVAYSAPSHCLNQCSIIVNWTPRNKIKWNINQNTKIFIHENASETIVCEMAAILSRGRCVTFLPEASFGLRVLSLPASVCVYVCVCGNHLLVRTITCHPFKLESPNLDQKSKTPWLRFLLFWGLIDLELQGQI